MVSDEMDETFEAAFTKRLKLPRRISAEPMSELNFDAMDKGKGGVSYPPNLADAKEETPNGTNGIPCRTMDERRNAAEPMSASNADAIDEERRYRLADGASTKNIERTE